MNLTNILLLLILVALVGGGSAVSGLLTIILWFFAGIVCLLLVIITFGCGVQILCAVLDIMRDALIWLCYLLVAIRNSATILAKNAAHIILGTFSIFWITISQQRLPAVNDRDAHRAMLFFRGMFGGIAIFVICPVYSGRKSISRVRDQKLSGWKAAAEITGNFAAWMLLNLFWVLAWVLIWAAIKT